MVKAVALSLDNRRQVRSSRRICKDGEVQRHTGTHDVVHPDGQETDASPLVEEREVHTPSTHRNAPGFRVNICPVQFRKDLISRDDIHMSVGALVPRWVVSIGGVHIRFVVEELEGLLALLESTGVRVLGALAHPETHVDVESVGVACWYEGRS